MAKTDKLIEQAKEHLEQGETINAVVRGTYEVKIMGSDSTRAGLFLATDRRLVFYAKKLGGYDLESFPYGNISSFEQSKNMMGHSFSFFASGNKVHMKWISGSEDLEAFVTVVKARVGQRVAAGTQNEPVVPTVMDQIQQLGGLREAGILTEDEFNSKKQELLSRL
jgi:Bacterial PH domain/Short C-terminal domain